MKRKDYQLRFPNVRHPLYDPEYCATLTPQDATYWMVVANGRAIGYSIRKGAYWHARLKLKRRRYVRTSLGAANADGRVGTRPILTFDQALAAAHEWFGTFGDDATSPIPSTQRDPEIPSPPTGTTYTCAHAIAEHLQWLLDTGSDIRTRLWVAKRSLLPAFGDIPLDRLTAEDIKAWLHRETNRPARYRAHVMEQDPGDALRARQRTMNGELSILRGALNHAFVNRKVDSDAEWRRVPVFANTNRAFADRLEIETIRANLKHAEPDEADLILTCLLTGSRMTGALGIHVGDVDLAAGKVRIVATKKRRTFAHILSDEALQLFGRLASGRHADEPLLVRSDGRAWTPLSARSVLARLARRSGQRRLTFKALRHTYACHLAEAGVPTKIIADQLGHQSSVTTEIYYAHLSEDVRDAALRKLVPRIL